MIRAGVVRAGFSAIAVITVLAGSALGAAGAGSVLGAGGAWGAGGAIAGPGAARASRAAAPSQVRAPVVLTSGQDIRSPNRQYRAIVQSDGNVVVYGNGRALWATGTAGTPGAQWVLQSDGNLVLYDRGGHPRWSSRTPGTGSTDTLAMQDDGNLVLYGARGALWATGAPGSDSLSAPGSLSAGQFLHSPNGRYRIGLGVHGDLTLVDGNGGRVVWSTGARGSAAASLVVQTDGNVVLYDASGAPLWASRTQGTGHANNLVVTDIGSLVVRAGVGPITIGSPYLIPTTHLAPVIGGCQVLHGQTPGQPLDLTAGVKVAMVQDRLGFPQAHPTWMDSETVGAVTQFQRSQGLPGSGRVDLATWQALGLPGDTWCVDQYEAPPALPLWATAQQRIGAELDFAESYVGGRYVYGGAGTRAQGVDCSGLVQQSLFHAGLDIQPVPQAANDNNHDTSSYSVYADPRLRHVPLAQRQPGDLVFFTSKDVVEHVAIYVGAGMLVNALNVASGVAYTPFTTNLAGLTILPTVVRPFG